MGNGLTPSTNYDGVEDPKGVGVAGLYARNRNAVYSYPDETKNTTNLLTFNAQRVLDANTELAGLATVLLAFVSGGVLYLSTVEWRDRRRRKAQESPRRP
jgi:hypothetical protein